MADSDGEFKTSIKNVSFSKTADGQLQQTMDFEGTATGFGTIVLSLMSTQLLSEAGATSGPISLAGKALLDDNSIMGAIGEGTWEQIGNEPRFKVSLLVDLSDGAKHRVESVMDWSARRRTGRFEVL